MSSQCPELWELDESRAHPATHPVRLHLEQCSRCQTSLLAMDSFLNEDDLATDLKLESLQPENLERADAQLSRFIENLTDKPSRRPYPQWFMGMAAVLIAGIGLWMTVPMMQEMRTPSMIQESPVMRGEEVATPGKQLVLISAQRLTNGDLRLKWNPANDGSAYQVVFWNDELMEFLRLPETVETSKLIGRDLVPTPEEGRYYCVFVLRDGKEQFRSKMKEVPPIIHQ